MRSLLPIGVVTGFLGVRPREWRRLMEEDQLPIIKIPGRTRPCHKVQARMLWIWLKARTVGDFLTYEDFIEELEVYLNTRKESGEAKLLR